MLISQDIWQQSVGVELVRNGDDVTLNIAASASGYYDDYYGYYIWYGSLSVALADQSDYIDQYYDRPMDLSVTATLTAGVAVTGSFDAEGDPTVVSTFNVILFDTATTYVGGSGIDYIFGSGAGDKLSGGAGDDGIEAGGGDDWLNGGPGGDLLDGGAGFDVASYAGATGAVVARLYDSTLNEGDARGDRYISIEGVEGSGYNDHLYGDGGANTLWGGDGADTLFGLGGNDTLIGGKGADFLIGGAGVDTASYVDSAQGVVASLKTGTGTAGDAAGDVLIQIENLTGSAFNDKLIGDDGVNRLSGGMGDDTLIGGAGDDTLLGGAGADWLDGGAGADWLDGGIGDDTVLYSDAKAGVRANLSNTAFNTGDAKGDVYVSIENMVGSAYNDVLIGTASENIISGGDGDDVIDGLGGSDRLRGGAGRDTFVFDTALNGLNNVDRLLDFSVAEDTIRLSHAIFTALTPGALGADAFAVGTAATTAAQHILYNANTGVLSYDSDGSGVAKAVAFAMVAPGLAVTAGQIFVS